MKASQATSASEGHSQQETSIYSLGCDKTGKYKTSEADLTEQIFKYLRKQFSSYQMMWLKTEIRNRFQSLFLL